jgi:hypothetical protein
MFNFFFVAGLLKSETATPSVLLHFFRETIMFARNLLPNGRIQTVPMTQGEQRVGLLIRTWAMLRKSRFFMKLLMAKRRVKYEERLNKTMRRMKRIGRERRIRAAMRMSKRQLAEELVSMHELINGLEKRMDEQLMTNRHLVHELDQCNAQIQTFERDYTRRNVEFSRHILHINDQTFSLVEDLMQRINQIERRLPEEDLFGES